MLTYPRGRLFGGLWSALNVPVVSRGEASTPKCCEFRVLWLVEFQDAGFQACNSIGLWPMPFEPYCSDWSVASFLRPCLEQSVPFCTEVSASVQWGWGED